MSHLDPTHDHNHDSPENLGGDTDHRHGVDGFGDDEVFPEHSDVAGHADAAPFLDDHAGSFTHGVADCHDAIIAHGHTRDADSVLATHSHAGHSVAEHTDHSVHFGRPDGEGFVAQTTPFTCGVMTQKMVLDAFGRHDERMGRPFSEASLLYDAVSHGWITGRGMPLRHLGELLQLHGIPTHRGHSAKQLLSDLSAGRHVIVPVDSHRLWSHGDDARSYGHAVPDHVVVLRGIRVDEHGRTHVIVNDPGREEGAGNEYEIDHFKSALDVPHLDYIATDRAPASWEHDSGSVDRVADRAFAHETFKHVVEQLSAPERHDFFRRI